jgi:uncharacterized phage-associated protein
MSSHVIGAQSQRRTASFDSEDCLVGPQAFRYNDRGYTGRAKMMLLPFDEMKATQAACLFLTLGHGKKMPYIKLIKLLYLLDRAALWKWGRPVTTSRYISMEWGPVVENIHDLIVEPSTRDSGRIWRRHVSPPSHLLVWKVKDPGVGKLSRAEEKLIVAIFTKFGAMHWSKLVDVTHTFAEWRNPGTRKKTPIDVRDILKAGRKADSEIEEIVSELESLAVVERMI